MAAISASPPPPWGVACGVYAGRPRASSTLEVSPRLCLFSGQRLLSPLRLVSSRLHSLKPSSSGANESLEGSSSSSSSSSSSGGGEYEVQYAHPPHPRSGQGAPVFVTLPHDAVGLSGKMARKKTMWASLLALASAGVEGVVLECWWGIVEREAPRVYDWGGYMDLVTLANNCGLKVRAIMAFHQRGTGPGDPGWSPLPQWVLEEMETQPDLAFSDRFGRRNKEYLSLGCDVLPVLKGRSPLQAYSDFMRSFKDTFRDFLGVVITEVQVGMGPGGELRYPSLPTEKLTNVSSAAELAEFQCYDKYMLASLRACTESVDATSISDLLPNPKDTSSSFKSDGSWNNTSFRTLFLEWYSGLLLLHAQRLCMVTDAIFWGTSVNISAKVAVIHWRYEDEDTAACSSFPAEFTIGYYNTLIRDGYLPIARMFGRYRIGLCCTCFDMGDSDQRENEKGGGRSPPPTPSPEGFLRRLLYAARRCNLPLIGENLFSRLDDVSLNQVIKNFRIYYDSAYNSSSFSFNYVRMDRNLFHPHNWTRFSKFVKRMSGNLIKIILI
ncbi:beta-amylase 3, chloroplastic-like [Curcuma longa]|uniref:beta-amylase 3, chloroplastic-like n=1 Tax=Curcuma longa TaxID=136217 RepID=UPI003D9E2A83